MSEKLAIAAPAVAPKVPFTPARNLLLQRKCACGAGSDGGECDSCASKKLSLQRHAATDGSVSGRLT